MGLYFFFSWFIHVLQVKTFSVYFFLYVLLDGRNGITYSCTELTEAKSYIFHCIIVTLTLDSISFTKVDLTRIY